MIQNDLVLSVSGLDMARDYYERYGKAPLEAQFSTYMEELTIGLVGEGSECFGFDDRLSADHDYGASFCIWLSEPLYQEIAEPLSSLYRSLPHPLDGQFRLRREQASDRRGVLSTLPFYKKFLGGHVPPESLSDWLRIPEEYLAVACNGTLFHAPDTEFLRIRKALQEFYPEDVRRKKLAANLIKMAHAGQVNYPRMATRKDAVAARLALDQFVERSMRTLYLLNRRYSPYYKWMRRGLENLPLRGAVPELLDALASGSVLNQEQLLPIIDRICAFIVQQLQVQGCSTSDDLFLEKQAFSVYCGISSPELRRLPIMLG